MDTLMDLFSKVFFETTNPNTSYNRLLSFDILISIIFHTLAYIIIICVISNVFNIKTNKKIYIKASIFLIIVMILGYIGRLSRVKSIYNYLSEVGYNNKESTLISMKLLQNDYFKFYFLA